MSVLQQVLHHSFEAQNVTQSFIKKSEIIYLYQGIQKWFKTKTKNGSKSNLVLESKYPATTFH